MKRRTLALALLCAHAPLALAAADFKISNIRVEGNRQIEAATVLGYLPVHAGDEMNDALADQAIHALYATGFFQDVQLRDDSGTLVVAVVERPTIGEIDVNGAKAISKKDLLKGLEDMGIAAGRPFNRSQVDQAVAEITRSYQEHSLFNAQVTAATSPMSGNRVLLSLNISEGRPTRVARIHITGNHAFTEKELLSQLTLRPSGLFTRFTHADAYSKEKMQGDLERLRAFYLDRGYLDFAIDSDQVTPGADGQGLDIGIQITEGAPYRISALTLTGTFPVPKAELAKLLSVHSGDVFDRQALRDSIQQIGDRLGEDGYAYASVDAQPQLDAAHHTAAFNLVVHPGHRVYIRRININGNSKTYDAVVRREFRQLESGLYNTAAIHRSKVRLDRLGYFSDVKIQAVPVAGMPDLTDLDVNVTERPTGQISVGAGYDSVDKVLLNAGIQQPNLFGTGNAAALDISTGKVNRVLSLSYTNPYYTPNGISRGFDVYDRRFDSSSLTGVAPYSTETKGAGVRYGVPLSETNTANFGIAVENTKIGLFPGSPQRYQQFVQQHGPSNTVVPLTAGWSNDTRDSLIFPRKGHLNSFTVEAGVGTLRYFKLGYQGQIYQPVTANTTLMFNTNLGYGGGQLPFYKNFYAGGPNSVRGFAWGAIGPRDPVDDTALGGSHMATANLEYFFPAPGMRDNRNVRLSVFADAGDVWGGGLDGSPDNTFSFSRIRASAGFGLTWYSPLGPLKFSVAKPLRREPGDQTEVFQFSIGGAF